MTELKKLITDLTRDNALLQAVLSSPKSQKISIRQLMLKGKPAYQVSYHDKKITHKNVNPEECAALLLELLPQYKQALFCTEKETIQVLQSKKGAVTILRKPASQPLKTVEHNRTKNYILKEDVPLPFLVELGVMTPDGKVYSAKRDKFRQINRFLEMISDILPHLPKPLKIVDFGCGKAYLTFALYHYLKELGYPLQIIGLDLKEDVVAFCQSVADKLNFTHLQFIQGDIASYSENDPVDLVVCLHACDTATDEALKKAVAWKAKVIMAVPCCQHELFKQIKCPPLAPLLKHGVLKERFAALATDALRAHRLEILGYKTQVFEFIDLEHTPKNLIIRAVLQGPPKNKARLIEEYEDFKKFVNASPSSA